MKCLIYKSKNYCASYNLAVEEFLFELAERIECVILYLWQNDKAVVLGRNQNAYNEVNLKTAQQFDVQVVRRMTGGGAVFHDLGNLNYTFIFPHAYRERDFMYQILISVFEKLGITVFVGGRNDIYIEDFKFSGNAFYTNGRTYLHHGTILVDSDLDIMNAVLYTPLSKMASRSIKSVRARVKNIKDIAPNITIDDIKSIIVKKYEIWAMSVFNEYVEEIQIEEKNIENFRKKYKDPVWNFGNGKKYEYEKETKFEWGNAKIMYNQKNGIIIEAKIYTDSLIIDEVENAEKDLIGKRIQV